MESLSVFLDFLIIHSLRVIFFIIIMAVWNIAVDAVERTPKNGFSASRVRFILARKPLAERVDKKFIAMDKKILLR